MAIICSICNKKEKHRERGSLCWNCRMTNIRSRAKNYMRLKRGFKMPKFDK